LKTTNTLHSPTGTNPTSHHVDCCRSRSCWHGKDHALDWPHSRTLWSARRPSTNPLVFFLSGPRQNRSASEQRNGHPEIPDLDASYSTTTSHLALANGLRIFSRGCFYRHECIGCYDSSIQGYGERCSTVHFIVDALDECEQSLESLIKLISTSLSLSDKVRWLVSSRPEVDVLSELKSPDISRIVDLDAQGLDGPVDTYIRHKLSTLTSRKGYTEINLA
jgi:hypothetical protein